MPVPYDTNTTALDLVSDYAAIIEGKTILVTGVTLGTLGGVYVKSIATAGPAHLILAGRNMAKLEQCKAEIAFENSEVDIRLLQIDTGSLDSVRNAASQVNAWIDIPVIDLLVNNAGIMAVDYKLLEDGFEAQFTTNHLGPFLFTNLIMEKILKSACARVVTVASDLHRLSPIRFDDYNFDEGKTYNKWFSYGQSKTANMLMALSLANKLGIKNGLQAFSLQPGVIPSTNLGAHLNLDQREMENLASIERQLGNAEGWEKSPKLKSIEQGVATHIFASFAPSLKANNGAYLVDSHVADPLTDTLKTWATSSLEAEKLWKLSENLVGEKFAY